MQSLSISKMWSTFFCAVNIPGELNNLVEISICKIKPELSGNIESKKKADNILEMLQN